MSTESQRDLLTSIYKRLLTIENHDYQSLPPIRSPILLIKPTQTSIKQIEEDYGLKQVFRITILFITKIIKKNKYSTKFFVPDHKR